jgi:hypothetical protein
MGNAVAYSCVEGALRFLANLPKSRAERRNDSHQRSLALLHSLVRAIRRSEITTMNRRSFFKAGRLSELFEN